MYYPCRKCGQTYKNSGKCWCSNCNYGLMDFRSVLERQPSTNFVRIIDACGICYKSLGCCDNQCQSCGSNKILVNHEAHACYSTKICRRCRSEHNESKVICEKCSYGITIEFERCGKCKNLLYSTDLKCRRCGIHKIPTDLREYAHKQFSSTKITLISNPIIREIRNISESLLELDTLGGGEFEDYLENLFNQRGWIVQKTSLSGDFGVDLIIEKNHRRIAIQAKRYKNPVGFDACKEVIAGAQYWKCNEMMIITTSTFTDAVKKFSQEVTKIKLWDFTILKNYIINEFEF